MERFVQASNRHDVDALMALFTDDCVFESPRGLRPQGRRIVGRGEVRRAFARLLARYQDARYSDVEHWSCGLRGVSEWNLIRRQEGENVPLLRGCDLWRFRDGKIAHRNSFWKIVASSERSAGGEGTTHRPP